MDTILHGETAGVDDAFRMIKGEVASLLMESGAADWDESCGGHRGKASKVKTVTIGHVPDRGGRPEGVSRQQALMPEWQKRVASEKGHGGNKGGNQGGNKGNGGRLGPMPGQKRNKQAAKKQKK